MLNYVKTVIIKQVLSRDTDKNSIYNVYVLLRILSEK